MRKKVKRRKKKFWKPVAAGFAVMYLVTMGLATWLVKIKFTEEYISECEDVVAMLGTVAVDRESSMEQENRGSEERKQIYQNLAVQQFIGVDGEFIQYSAAFYDEDKNLFAQSQDQIGGSMMSVSSSAGDTGGEYRLDDYLTQEEKEELAAYYNENAAVSLLEVNTMPAAPEFRFYIQEAPEGDVLYAIYVQQVTWSEEPDEEGNEYIDPLSGAIHTMETDEHIDLFTGEKRAESKVFYETDSKIVWEWNNQNVSEEQRKNKDYQETALAFPYGMRSFNNWRRWSSSGYLHGFPEKGDFVWGIGGEYPTFLLESDGLYLRGRYPSRIGLNKETREPYAYLEVRMEARPWHAAMDYMKYAYLSGALLALTCMAVLIYALNNTFEKQAALEETRRDFTNAIAHELKTPLGVIRNFAENLMEHHMEEKREYYLSQIIGQTEEMDHLVAEMIEVSKLDSDGLVLQKEEVSFSGLIREQLARFDPMIQEKNLLVRYEEAGDFQVEGDREYLAKAVWNLVSNAVDYNIPGGSISIRIGEGECVIENTGLRMGEEQLAHAFDLFYTGNKSRGGRGKHMGMGLFLAKKILELHGMGLALESTGDGIRAVIKIERRKNML